MSFRLNKKGQPASFVLYDPATKKNTRYTVPVELRTPREAKEFKHKVELKLGIAQIKAKKRFEFLNKYKNQQVLFDAFVKYRKKTRPQSYYEEGSRLKNYAFPFFIGELNLNHPSLWFSHWNEFHDYISSRKLRNNTKGKSLAVNTKNNIVKAVNAFIAFVELKEASGDPIKRVPEFKFEEIGRRGIESVYTLDEFNKLISEVDHKLIFQTLYHTGMRVNEVLSLEKKDIVIGKLPSVVWIFKTLQENKVDTFGFVLLKHQYDKDGNKKPLKGKKRIAPENNRIIPLTDKAFIEELFKHIRTIDDGDKIFNMSYQQVYTQFKKAQKKIGLSLKKDIHSLRHTYTTKFVRWCGGDPRAVEKVLGHSKSQVTEIYNHLAEELESQNYEEMDNVIEIKPIKIG